MASSSIRFIVHVIIRRLVGETGQSAVLEETGESFAELSERCAAGVICELNRENLTPTEEPAMASGA